MAIKKSDPYSSLCACSDELRSGMDASHYPDRVMCVPHTSNSRHNSSWKTQ